MYIRFFSVYLAFSTPLRKQNQPSFLKIQHHTLANSCHTHHTRSNKSRKFSHTTALSCTSEHPTTAPVSARLLRYRLRTRALPNIFPEKFSKFLKSFLYMYLQFRKRPPCRLRLRRNPYHVTRHEKGLQLLEKRTHAPLKAIANDCRTDFARSYNPHAMHFGSKRSTVHHKPLQTNFHTVAIQRTKIIISPQSLLPFHTFLYLRQLAATFATTRIDHGTTAFGRHPRPKSAHAHAFQLRWMIRWLHSSFTVKKNRRLRKLNFEL